MTDNPDQQRQADISDAHHEGFGAGVAWSDSDFGINPANAVAPFPTVEDWATANAALRQSLTEAEASHQAEIGRLRAELDEARTWRGVQAFIDEQYPTDVFPVGPDSEERDDGARILSLLRRIADLEHTITQYLDSHGTAGTGVLGKRLKAAVGRVE